MRATKRPLVCHSQQFFFSWPSCLHSFLKVTSSTTHSPTLFKLCFHTSTIAHLRRTTKRFSNNVLPPKKSKLERSAAKIHLMWATPIYHRQLNFTGIDKLNQELSTIATEEYFRFKSERQDKTLESSQREGLNEAFFEWQRQAFEASGETATIFDKHECFRILKKQIWFSVNEFLETLGIDPDADENITDKPQEYYHNNSNNSNNINTKSSYLNTDKNVINHKNNVPNNSLGKQNQNQTQAQIQTQTQNQQIQTKNQQIHQYKQQTLFYWSAVHEKAMAHPPHVHPGSLVSGVYYSQICPGAGNLTFEDPRGPLPPFLEKLTIKPKEGDLILFPGWLSHYVTPTWGGPDDTMEGMGSGKRRVSFSFNVEGDWKQLSDVGMRLE